MSQITRIPIDSIDRRADCRIPDGDTITNLAESIEAVGLINPIRVRRVGGRYELIAGSHRYAAVDSLDWREIPAVIVDDDDLHAELAMIDENLCRAELSPSDRARQTARRKSIYEELHPETRPTSEGGGGRNNQTRRQVGDDIAERFTANTAAATGQSERKVQRDAERGEKVVAAAHDLVRHSRLDTGRYLDELKRCAPEEQVERVRRDLEARVSRAKRVSSTTGENAALFPRFCKLAEEMTALSNADLIESAGQQRSSLAGWVSTLSDKMDVLWAEVGK
ncbi:ParB/RepB/Spo0J family partition protein [Fulvimarina manganoxydans]|uniref:ParB/RepB/Spo0J family partition protein n=1 Tax=Fulvimarina manganoxydans TaxID=937218 RepID=A0A1W2D3M3_9HYPH|nr:ParB N-terminal domain-containing protein [Fulvimarina manganoxydans]SMC92031.1 ParB/RepB/Spo0J family partition protein [Fulvimarina manganoxydans]